jgi:hypothetical protein
MQKSQIEIGKEFALRESRTPNTPLQRVKILQHIRGKKWKAEWIDPNPGLIEFVESQNLLVRWKDHKALLRDEERERQLQQDQESQGYKASSPLDNVLSQVFDAAGEQGLYCDGGVLQGPPEAVDRIRERARLDPAKKSPLSYIDRHGTIQVPYAEAFELGKAFCAAEPSTVLIEIEATERKWTNEARSQAAITS